jgi:hypothetical protein
MGLRPQTLYGIADSPVGLAAWMIDHDLLSYQAISRLFVEGTPYGALTDKAVCFSYPLAPGLQAPALHCGVRSITAATP